MQSQVGRSTSKHPGKRRYPRCRDCGHFRRLVVLSQIWRDSLVTHRVPGHRTFRAGVASAKWASHQHASREP